MVENTTITVGAVHKVRAKENITIVDIRKKPDDRQIPGSIRYDGEMLASSEKPPFGEDATVIVYCGSGNSCQRVAAQLREKGIDARAIDGGYAAWKEAGFSTEPISEKQSL